MTLLTLAAALLVVLAMVVREVQIGTERRRSKAQFDRAHQTMTQLAHQLNRAREDVYVLKTVLRHKGVMSDEEFARQRALLIEAPRQKEAERQALTDLVGSDQTHRIIDEGETIH